MKSQGNAVNLNYLNASLLLLEFIIKFYMLVNPLIWSWRGYGLLKINKNLRHKSINEKKLDYNVKIILISALSLETTIFQILSRKRLILTSVAIIIFIKRCVLEYKAMLRMKRFVEVTLHSSHERWFLSLHCVMSPGVDQKWPPEENPVFLVVHCVSHAGVGWMLSGLRYWLSFLWCLRPAVYL